jgi:hypothetical protein
MVALQTKISISSTPNHQSIVKQQFLLFIALTKGGATAGASSPVASSKA